MATAIRTTTTIAMAEANPARQAPPPEKGRREGVASPPAKLSPAVAEPATLSPATLQRLLAWLSPAFPVGGYSYSHGLEWSIADGTVTDAAGLEAWIGDIVRHGAGRSDAILFAHAWRAVTAGDAVALRDIVELAAALQPSRERHVEATAQGRAFLLAVSAAWPDERFAALVAALPWDVPVTYPFAVAMAAACAGIPVEAATPAWLAAFAANLASAGVRAIPIGQTDGQRIIARLVPVIEAISAEATAATLDDIGGLALRADIASMRHETQYTRLFRS
jgi:urease accessory protein